MSTTFDSSRLHQMIGDAEVIRQMQARDGFEDMRDTVIADIVAEGKNQNSIVSASRQYWIDNLHNTKINLDVRCAWANCLGVSYPTV